MHQITVRGYPVRKVSRRLGVSTHSLYKWMKLFGEHAPKTPGVDHKAGNRRLKRELARVTEERDILKGNGVRRARVAMMYAFNRALRVHFSGFCMAQGTVSRRAQQDARLTELIRQVWADDGKVYSYHKLTDDRREHLREPGGTFGILGRDRGSGRLPAPPEQALPMAVWRRKPDGKIMVHSDQCSQFTSREWQTFFRQHDLEPSMSRRRKCHDNAESFFQLLKRERIKRRTYPTRDDARRDVIEFIELFYKTQAYEQRHAVAR